MLSGDFCRIYEDRVLEAGHSCSRRNNDKFTQRQSVEDPRKLTLPHCAGDKPEWTTERPHRPVKRMTYGRDEW